MNLTSAFAASVEKRPGKVALCWGEREFTYADLLGQSCAVAADLSLRFGVKPGDRMFIPPDQRVKIW